MSPIPDGSAVAELQKRLELEAGLGLFRKEALAPRTTLRIGGAAELFAEVMSESALARLLTQAAELRVPCRLLGLGSNVLLPDEGLRGVVVVLEGDFLETSFEGTSVSAGAGLPLARVARLAVERGLSGLEALAGFPSTVGGAVIMNAGCYGVEIKDVLESTTILRPNGDRYELQVEDLSPGYRTTNLQGSDAVVTQATFRLQTDESDAALDRLNELNRRRRERMPSGKPNAGSIFRNPPGDYAGRLIESCGLKGRQEGGAEISSVHANVIVNNGEATAADVLELMRVMYRAVEAEFRLLLEPELILVGPLGDRWRQIVKNS